MLSHSPTLEVLPTLGQALLLPGQASRLAGRSTSNPSILQGEAMHLASALYVAIDVCTAFTLLTMLISIAALAVQLVRKEQRKIVKRVEANGGAYLLPYSPVLAPIMVTSYCIVGAAASFVLRAWLIKGTQTPVVQRVSWEASLVLSTSSLEICLSAAEPAFTDATLDVGLAQRFLQCLCMASHTSWIFATTQHPPLQTPHTQPCLLDSTHDRLRCTAGLGKHVASEAGICEQIEQGSC